MKLSDMRTILVLLGFTFMFSSCYKPGSIEVRNNINNVELQDVYWGDHFISESLLPGQTSSEVSIQKHEEKLPASNQISFEMTANGQRIFLETKTEFLLNEDEVITVVLEEDTEVQNSNQ